MGSHVSATMRSAILVRDGGRSSSGRVAADMGGNGAVEPRLSSQGSTASIALLGQSSDSVLWSRRYR